MLLDLMTCPYVDNSFKNQILTIMGFSSSKAGQIRVKLSKPEIWFFNWNNLTEFQSYLKKKEFNRPYD